MTFPNPAVKNRINRFFVPSYVNAFPGFSGQELRQGVTDMAPHFAAWWGSGTADTNVATVITTPEGEVIHMIRGFVRPEDFAVELDFARNVAKAADQVGLQPEARRNAIIRRHRLRQQQLWLEHGDATQAIDTTIPPAPNAFVPDRYPHLLIAMHQSVIDGGTDVGLVPCRDGVYDGSTQVRLNQAIQQGATGLAPAPAVVAAAPPVAPPPANTISQASQNVGGVTNVSANPPPPPPPPEPVNFNGPSLAPPTGGATTLSFGNVSSGVAAGPVGPAAGPPGVPGQFAGNQAAVGLAATAPTAQDLARAKLAYQAEQAATDALVFYAPPGKKQSTTRNLSEAQVVKALRDSAPASLNRLFDRLRVEPNSPAVFAALRAATRQDLPADAMAWRKVLDKLSKSAQRN